MKYLNYFLVLILVVLWTGCHEDPVVDPDPEVETLVTPEMPTTIGQHALTLQWEGIDRVVYINIPTSYDATNEHPLVLFLHGGSGNAFALLSSHSNFAEDVENAGMILVTPQGTLTHSGAGYRWNAWDDDNTTNDIGFLAALIEWVTEELSVDQNRRFMTGFSNGAAMSQRFATEKPEMILAAAAVCHTSGFTYIPEKGGERFGLPNPVAPVSILMVRGGSDNIIPDNNTPTTKGKIIDTPFQQLNFWLDASVCDDTDFVEETPEAGVMTRRYENCDNDKAVHLWFSEFLIHKWPNNRTQFGLDVNEIVVSFFVSR